MTITRANINYIRCATDNQPHLTVTGKNGSYRIINILTERGISIRTGQWGHSIQQTDERINGVMAEDELRNTLDDLTTDLYTAEHKAMTNLQDLGKLLVEQATTAGTDSIFQTTDAITRQQRELSRIRGRLDAAWKLNTKFRNDNQVASRTNF